MRITAEQELQLKSDIRAAIRSRKPNQEESFYKVFDDEALDIISEAKSVDFIEEPKSSAQIVAALVSYRLRVAGDKKSAMIKNPLKPTDAISAGRLVTSSLFDTTTRIYAGMVVSLLDLEK